MQRRYETLAHPDNGAEIRPNDHPNDEISFLWQPNLLAELVYQSNNGLRFAIVRARDRGKRRWRLWHPGATGVPGRQGPGRLRGVPYRPERQAPVHPGRAVASPRWPPAVTARAPGRQRRAPCWTLYQPAGSAAPWLAMLAFPGTCPGCGCCVAMVRFNRSLHPW